MRQYTQADHEEYRRKVDEQAKKEEEANRERTAKESARRAWLADGGSGGDFEKAWPELRDEGRRRRVMDADKHARGGNADGESADIYRVAGRLQHAA
jgi:hypothetical protein